MDMDALSRVEFLRKENKMLRKNLKKINKELNKVKSLYKLLDSKASDYTTALYYLDVRTKDIF